MDLCPAAPFILELCAGIGGLGLGIELAVPDARPIAFVERESYAAATLAARMEEGALDPAPIWTELASFDARAWRGIVDCVASGDPCQPNSLVGQMLGSAMSDSSSIKCSGSLMSAGLIVCSARMSVGTPMDSSPLLSLLWSDWAIALRREFSARPRLEHHMIANGCSLWPTPLARDHKDGTVQVIRDGKLRLDTLPRALGGPANPDWLDWLMGLPVGWTGQEPLATPLCRFKRLMRGSLSRICSPRPDPQMRLF
jgi:hypothetical protein